MNQYQTTKLLVIDDDLDFRSSMMEYFSSKGYRISGAENGQIALNMMSHTHYDIVLLDLNMPVLDGFNTMKEIQKIYRDTHIYIISGAKDIKKYAYYKSGCILFESKPVDVIELELKIRNIVRLLEKSRTKKVPDNTNIDLELNAIYDFIIENADNVNLNVYLIAQSLNFSVNYIYEKFRNLLTVSLHDTIKNIRLLKAHSIIRNRPISSIKELSVSSGYKDAGYFARMYKEAFGVDLFDEIKAKGKG
jgi:YesN/AraC family two-component response regulator